eukprot:COSAG02_NODE_3059_length_7451_cov_11.870919_4_plen_79_part_00
MIWRAHDLTMAAQGGVRGSSFISGAGITGGRTSMELHASTDWMPSLLSVALNGVAADPTTATRVPWTAVLVRNETTRL